jgi:uncharacterized Rmd1/YagE family protein
MAMTAESTPLLAKKPDRPVRSVTFNPTIATSSPPSSRPMFPSAASHSSGSIATLQQQQQHAPLRDGSQPMLSALNSKLRRRNSQGAPSSIAPTLPAAKIGPQRTTRTAQKLKLLPNPEHGDEGPDEESGRDVYSQFTRIKDPTARRDAARLGKDDRDKLPRVTAYCTASSYRMEELLRFLKGRKLKKAAPKQFDECIYTPYQYNPRNDLPIDEVKVVHSTAQRRFSDSAIEVESNAERRREDLLDMHGESTESAMMETPEPSTSSDALIDTPDFDTTVHVPEIFCFEYGVVVIWGMSVQHEQKFLKELAKFETEKLGKDDIQQENFNFYYTKEYQARIYNDFISLREKKNYMTKLAISHALAQSTKVGLSLAECEQA